MEVSKITISSVVELMDVTNVRQRITTPRLCMVCGDVAQYSYYGAIVCQPCKVFFRRNAQSQKTPLICQLNNQCEININNRRTCSSCRLGKCFSSGMQVEMIRSFRTKQIKKIEEKQMKISSRSTVLIPTLNLLRNDHSTLSTDQWNHLSNLIHCFDEYSGLSFVKHFLEEQTSLPPKFRFKYSSVNAFITTMMTKVQLVFEKSRDFRLISLHDRKMLLHSTGEYTASIGCAFLLGQTQLFDRPAFFRSAELIFRPSAIVFTRRLIDQLDSDITFLKMTFSIIAFFASNYTIYTHHAPTHLDDLKKILKLEDIYTDLVWRYLVYRYNDRQAVLCFANLIRCLLLLHDSIVQSHEEPLFTDIINSVVKATEDKLNINT